MKDISDLVRGKSVLITGGTGSFGNQLTETLLQYEPRRLIIFSRDEYKQHVMRARFPPEKYKCMRYFIGDVRDKDRVCMAFCDVDLVFHAAALKQVPPLEYNPDEAIKTNIIGSQNVIHAAIVNKVPRVVAISTDKSVQPVNLYGATKMVVERLFVAANNQTGPSGPLFSVLRYGNVFASRGSVVPVFLRQKDDGGVLTLTDANMTRFTLTLEDAIAFVLQSCCRMIGGEIFVPKLPSYSVGQLARVLCPGCPTKVVGARPGEKMHESMIGGDESHMALEFPTFYIVQPQINMQGGRDYVRANNDVPCTQVKAGFNYSSGTAESISDEVLQAVISARIKPV